MKSLELALSHHQAGRYKEAKQLYENTLQSDPDNPDATHLLGVLHNALGQYNIGIVYIKRAIELMPSMVEAHYNLGNSLTKIGFLEEAISAYDKAIKLNPQHKNAWLNKGDAYRTMRKFLNAEDSYRGALSLDPADHNLYVRLGVVLRNLGRMPEAVSAYHAALEIAPSADDANLNLANILFDSGRFDQALTHYRRATVPPTVEPWVTDLILACVTKTCAWDDPLMLPGALENMKEKALSPFMPLLRSYSNQELQHFARRYSESVGLTSDAPRSIRPCTGISKIRIGYLSADYYRHATAFLVSELFEAHDRAKFEIVGISYGPDDSSPTRSRIVAAFDKFLDVADDDDITAAEHIKAVGIDILVDLKGHTQDSRPGILKHRPAPIIVSYLGYPGTMGTRVIDYVLADAVVLPFSDQDSYDERIVHLPDCYQVNDSKVEIDPSISTRAEHGIPEDAFVFCCLNGSQKITRLMFSVWMRVLARIPHGVLWLLRDNDSAVRNLQQEAARQGIDPTRLVFAPKIDHGKHLARYAHADLFLDTSPYNAHTTASDALRTHLPVLTVRGATFASRVAASLLLTVGTPELIASDLQAYEETACRLASNLGDLSATRDRIAEGVRAGPLFDTGRFARGIETAYLHMHAMACAGKPPSPFAVGADGSIKGHC
jgi:protein O-GlcNAc transferase